MKIKVTKKVILVESQDKGKVCLYTFIDANDYSKMVAIGNKTGETFADRSLVEVDIDIRTKNERFDLADGTRKYVEVASVFVSGMRLAGDDNVN